MIKKKVCSKCSEEKPATTEYFSKNGKYLRGECKECVAKYHKKNYQENKEKIDAKNKEWRDNNGKAVKIIAKRTYEKNKEKRQAESRECYKKNIEKERKRFKKYSQTSEGQASRINKRARRELRLGGRNEEIGKKDWLLIMESCDWKCFYCDCELTKKNRTVDHFVPLCRGGDHSIFNLVASCNTCNFSKQGSLYCEWRNKHKEEREKNE